MFAALAASLIASLIVLANLDRTPRLSLGPVSRGALFLVIILSALGVGMVAPVLWWGSLV